MRRHKNRIQRLILFILAPIVALSSIAGLQLFGGNSSAYAASVSLSTEDQAYSVAYYNDLRGCFDKKAQLNIKTTVKSPTAATPGSPSWFSGSNGTQMYVFGKQMSCDDIAKAALKLWGLKSDGSDFLTKIGYTFEASVPEYKAKSNQTVMAKFDSYVQSIAFNQNFAADAPMPDASAYYAYNKTFTSTTCDGKDLGVLNNSSETIQDYVKNKTVKDGLTYSSITLANADGTTTVHAFSYKGGDNGTYVYGGNNVASDASNDQSAARVDCSALIKKISGVASAAALDLAEQACAKTLGSSTAQPTLEACAKGMAHITSPATYCATTYDGNKTLETACFQGQGYGNGYKCAQQAALKSWDASSLGACLIGSSTGDCSQWNSVPDAGQQAVAGEAAACQYGVSIGPGTGAVKQSISDSRNCTTDPYADGCSTCDNGSAPAADGTCPEAPSCTISGIGWIVCPVMNFLSSVADSMYGILSSDFLPVPPLSTTMQASNGASFTSPTYAAWKVMQALGNVVLVIVFLVMIFSQLTDGFGSEQRLASWGVKKLLPRLVLAAVAMNLSFFVCEILIDLSNVFGVSIKELFDGVASNVASAAGTSITATVGNGNGWGSVAGTVLDVVAMGAIGYFALTMFGSLLLAAVLVLLMILFILIARQVLIVLLVVLAPLAFVAFILPNTQKLFKRWWDLLFALLMLFPIIGAVYGASELASVVLQYSYSAKFTVAGQTISNPNSSWFGQILASAVMVIPLVAVPFILKGALSAVPMLGQMTQKWAGRANSNLANKTKQSYQGSVLGRSSAIRRAAREQYRSRRFAERVGNGGLTGRIAGGLGITGAQRAAKQAVARSAFGAAQKAEAEDTAFELKKMTAESLTQSDSRAFATEQLRTALIKGEAVKAKAAYSLLYSQGQGGIEAARGEIEAHASNRPDIAAALREHILANHGDVKGRDISTSQFATEGMVPNDAALASGYGSLTDAELASQTKDSLRRMIGMGLVDHERAERILKSPSISPALKEDQRRMLTELAGGAGGSGGVPPEAPQAPTEPLTGGGSSGLPSPSDVDTQGPRLDIDHGGGAAAPAYDPSRPLAEQSTEALKNHVNETPFGDTAGVQAEIERRRNGGA